MDLYESGKITIDDFENSLYNANAHAKHVASIRLALSMYMLGYLKKESYDEVVTILTKRRVEQIGA